MSGCRVQCYLIGAGPGDPGLLTVRAREVLALVDVVIYDSLVNESILDVCRPECEKIFAGKRSGFHYLSQEQIHETLVDRLRKGKVVGRLKGGDPFVFARGGEEMAVVDEAGFGFEVIPGVTSGTAVPAYAGIPLTHREWASQVCFLTAHERDDALDTRVDWQALAGLKGTLVVYMGAGSLDSWVPRLLEGGLDPGTPAAFIQWGTRTSQRGVFATLNDLERKVREAGLGSPAIVVLGKTVSLRNRLRWFEYRPLFGKRVVVTRSREQNQTLSMLLRELGAEVLEIPTISIHGLSLPDDVSHRVLECDWLAFSSSNGVEYFMKQYCQGRDLRELGNVKLAAVGSSTAALLEQYHLKVDYIPTAYRSEVMARQWPQRNPSRVLYVCGNLATGEFEKEMAQAGHQVQRLEVYETREGVESTSVAAEIYRKEGADWLTFCSSSAVRAFRAAFPGSLGRIRVAAIGPVTVRELEKVGWPCHVMPDQSRLEHMVQCMVDEERKNHQ